MGAKNLDTLPTHKEVRTILEDGLRGWRQFDARMLPREELMIYRAVLAQMVKERHESSDDLEAITEYILLIRLNG